MRKLFTSESVTEGHPDKVCDRISDAVLDAVLAVDPNGRVACETCCTTDTVFIAGEITSKVDVDIEGIARRVLRDIGYTGGASGFDADTCKVMAFVHKQSPDIAMGTSDTVGGAGDQGMPSMFRVEPSSAGGRRTRRSMKPASTGRKSPMQR